jgi:putative sterol carrier protein
VSRRAAPHTDEAAPSGAGGAPHGRSDEFFERLAATEQPGLSAVDKTIRIDVSEPDRIDHVLLHLDRGRVTVAHRNSRADAVVSTDRVLFERLVTGEANALTATLRGRLRVVGDRRAVLAFERLLPSPPGRRTTLPPPVG